MPKISNEQLIQKEPYRSIIILLTCYRTGLQAKHFMYALSRKRDHSTKTMEYIDKEMERFFNRETYNVLTGKKEKQFLEELYQKQKTKNVVLHRRLTAGCIKSYGSNPHQHLNSCLTRLRERGWIEKSKKKGYYWYFLSKKFFHNRIIRSIKDELDAWDESMLISDFAFDFMMKEEGFPNIPSLMGKNVIWELCGITHKLWKEMEKNDKEKINGTIKNIKQNLETILQIKLMYLNIKEIRKSLKDIEDDDEKERYISNVFNIGFYSLATSQKKRFELLYEW